MIRWLHVVSLCSLILLGVLYRSGLAVHESLSPQGCRMSYMWPSYLLQNKFDHTWTPLARRYSLWLYREANFESHELHGAPVLFIPGNAGSSRQVRSIASSAAHQYFSESYQVVPEFADPKYKGLDFFAVEFNEDLSAFHGPTLDSETAYTSRAIDYILSRYPTGTSIIVLGHSMGGIVATSLLPHPNISAIITMSSPHSLPPVRFDRRIDHIYADNLRHLAEDPTPILSICGGATDLMIPSEACFFPETATTNSSVYRRTVFSSALEGCWTGVGHLAIVWCHQVRWRVARAALEVASLTTAQDRANSLDRWLRDGHALPASVATSTPFELHSNDYELVPSGRQLRIQNVQGSRTYILSSPATTDQPTKFVLYASQGTIGPVSPQRPVSFQAHVYLCDDQGADTLHCDSMVPTTLKLIPSPVFGAQFPVPEKGSDESEGVVLYEAEIPSSAFSAGKVVAIKVENGDGKGWVLGGYATGKQTHVDVATAGLILRSSYITLPKGSLRTEIVLPNVHTNSLVVYRVIPSFSNPSGCRDALLPPLLAQYTHPTETHYYPLAPNFNRPLLVHSHAAAPFVVSNHTRGMKLVVHSSGECQVTTISIRVDVWGTIGRWGYRYAPAAASWAAGVVALALFDWWAIVERSATILSMGDSLDLFVRKRLPSTLVAFFVISLLPLPEGLWLGNQGDPLFAFLAPALLLLAVGLVGLSWLLLRVLLFPLTGFLVMIGRRSEDTSSRAPRGAMVSMLLIFAVIFMLVPWQVAFLGCWLIHFYTTASSVADRALAPRHTVEAVPLIRVDATSTAPTSNRFNNSRTSSKYSLENQVQAHTHLLLLMTWLLPLAAPVLAVWVRTLATAGLTTPFDGDHNFLYVAPFLVLVEYMAERRGQGLSQFLERNGGERMSPRWGLLALAVVAFGAGPRTTYVVFEVASVALGWAVLARIGLAYWGGPA